MSRPPNQYHDIPNHIGNRYYTEPQIIDFKVGSPYAYEPSEYQPSSVYAQAGFPGYSQQTAGYNNPPYNIIASQATYPQPQAAYPPMPGMASQFSPACPSAFPQTYSSQMIASAAYPQMYSPHSVPGAASCQLGQQVSPLHTIQTMQSAQPTQPLSLQSSVDNEAVIQERIKANIDAIMETQKTAMLNSKLERLTDKVQSLAHNIGSSESSDVRTLSDRVERLSRNIAESGDSVHHIKDLSVKVEKLSRNIAESGEDIYHIKNLSSKVEQLSKNIADSGGEVSQLKTLSQRVEQLSRNMAASGEGGANNSHVKNLAEKVERLSRNLELSQNHSIDSPMESISTTQSVLSSASDSDISRRLKRLAAESSARQTRSDDRMPDW